MHQCSIPCLFFFNDTATTEIYTLSLHDALPISANEEDLVYTRVGNVFTVVLSGASSTVLRRSHAAGAPVVCVSIRSTLAARSEEHTSELQSRRDLVCRLLLEKKK